jgi:hypothetical protein
MLNSSSIFFLRSISLIIQRYVSSPLKVVFEIDTSIGIISPYLVLRLVLKILEESFSLVIFSRRFLVSTI